MLSKKAPVLNYSRNSKSLKGIHFFFFVIRKLRFFQQSQFFCLLAFITLFQLLVGYIFLIRKTVFLVSLRLTVFQLSVGYVFVLTIENGAELCIRVCCFFFIFFQSQVSQIIIGRGRVIYNLQALLVVIRTTLKNSKNIFY